MKKYLIGLSLAMAMTLLFTIVVLAAPTDITRLFGNPTDTTISLTWTKGSGNQTLVRFKTNGYPANTADGTQVYLGTLNYYTHSGLTAGTRYYYSAWSYDGALYSATAANLLIITNPTNELALGGMTAPTLSARFNQVVDATGLSTLEPFYSIGNSFSTGWGVDADRGWETFALSLIAGIALIIYAKWKELSISCFATFVLLGLTTMMELTPGWMMLIPVTVGMGAWALENAIQ